MKVRCTYGYKKFFTTGKIYELELSNYPKFTTQVMTDIGTIFYFERGGVEGMNEELRSKFEEVKGFQKSDVKEGMMVTFRDGRTGVISHDDNGMMIVDSKNDKYHLEYFDDNLMRQVFEDYRDRENDIMTVSNVLYDREVEKPVKKMTVAEAEKELERLLGTKVELEDYDED